MKILRQSALALTVTLGVIASNAQQLPNGGFEEDWEDCIPWNSKFTTTKQGQTPSPWCISNVVTPGMNLGNISPYEKVTGNGSETAVKLVNKSTANQVIPGYITLGTTWATARVKTTTVISGSADGGTWGGLKKFSYKPDALALDYIRTHGDDSADKACVIAYTWKGYTTQEAVPANNTYKFVLFGSSMPDEATTVTMENRERNILGMETSLGGDVSKSSDFELISVINYKIDGTTEDWTTLEVPFEYKSDATPEMINVILTSGSYFEDRTVLKGDDALTVDNVKLIYYSRLSELKIDGVAVDGFADNVYEYTVDVPYSRDALLDYTIKGQSATSEVSFDDDAMTATIKVSNIDADSDGQTSHSYVVKFAEPAADAKLYEGTITIVLMGGSPMILPDQHVTITATGDDKCTFALYNFNLGSADSTLGDIIVNDVTITHSADGSKTFYAGSVENMKIGPEGTPEESMISADVEVNGTEDANGNLVMKIKVIWHMGEGMDMPIDVEFKTNDFDVNTGIDSIVSDDNDATPHYYQVNGVEVKDATAPGLYIVRRGNSVSKLQVK